MSVTYTVPPTKKWIISKERRACTRCDDRKTDITIDEFTRQLQTKCTACGYSNVFELREFHDRRPCTSCKHVRRVTVTIMMGQEHCEDYCNICKLLASAIKHEQQAKVFRARAAKLLEERKRTG